MGTSPSTLLCNLTLKKPLTGTQYSRISCPGPRCLSQQTWCPRLPSLNEPTSRRPRLNEERRPPPPETCTDRSWRARSSSRWVLWPGLSPPQRPAPPPDRQCPPAYRTRPSTSLSSRLDTIYIDFNQIQTILVQQRYRLRIQNVYLRELSIYVVNVCMNFDVTKKILLDLYILLADLKTRLIIFTYIIYR